MQDTLVNQVDAAFGGQAVRFSLSRDPQACASLEAAIGSPFGAYKRFVANLWTVTDVRLVLAHATPGVWLLHGHTRVAAVDAALTARSAVTYAPLAVRILEAFLFGLEPARAVFDEDAPA